MFIVFSDFPFTKVIKKYKINYIQTSTDKRKSDRMIFPSTPRVHYKKNPLKKVVLQVRFPTILQIDSEAPASFQNEIRGKFPGYDEKFSVSQNININIGIKGMTQPFNTPTKSKQYEFSSADGKTKVLLTKNYLSIEADKYEQWEKFEEDFKPIFKALSESYSPAFYTRIGIRYIDVFSKTELGISDEINWKELINPIFLGLMGDDNISKSVNGQATTYELEDKKTQKKMRASVSTIYKMPDNEKCILLDTDIYTDMRTEIQDLDTQTKDFHKDADGIIRYFVTDKLHTIMEPEQI